MAITIVDVILRDIRFPTSRTRVGSDAVHVDADYSAAYVVLETDASLEGHGLTFTAGRGNELCVAAIQSLKPLITGMTLESITEDWVSFWRRLTQDSQFRWLGPEKGVIHLAAGAIINAVWDLWAKKEGKPVWQLVVDLSPGELVDCIDFRYISDVLSPREALQIVTEQAPGKEKRIKRAVREGLPAYNTSVGWLGYTDRQIIDECRRAMKAGWSHFKIKVGTNLEDDIRRLRLVRQIIGADHKLMVDANQKWDVEQAITWLRQLLQFDLLWAEEPTSADDILGHASISKAIRPVGVATGEVCHNRVMFKQFLQADALQFCQVDACRLAGLNEVLAVLLMAAKFGVPVCPHAGGVGLCEYVQHIGLIDFICIAGTQESRVVEYVDHLHEHFLDPVRIQNARYVPPEKPGYSITMRSESLEAYEFPNGQVWTS